MTSSDETPIGELTLRRFRAGELDESTRAQVAQALSGSVQLRATLKRLEDEQDSFEQAIGFEGFASGVRRAQRERKRPRRLWRYSAAGAMVTAAAGLALLASPQLMEDPSSRPAGHLEGRNRRKGSERLITAQAHVAGPTSSLRVAEAGKLFSLQPADRVRLELRQQDPNAKPWHLAVVSLDAAGVATRIYPEQGPSLPWPGEATSYVLPDALAFEGSGRETLFLILAQESFGVETAQTSLVGAWRKHGNLDQISVSDLPALANLTLIVFPFTKP